MRRLPLVLSCLLAVVGALTLLPGGVAHARSASTLAGSRTYGVAGQPVTFSGELATAVRRPLVLQRRLGAWLDVRELVSDRHGRFAVTVPLNGMAINTYRVLAPRATVAGRTYPRLVTATRRISTTTSATVSLHLSVDHWVGRKTVAEAAPGETVTATAATHPGDPGRRLTLQRRTAVDGWTRVASTLADENGRAQFTFTTPDVGYAVYRVLAAPYDGISVYPSYPHYLWVDQAPNLAPPASVDPIGGSKVVLHPQPGPVSAASTFKWGKPVENYSWESGEGITPTWTDDTNGTGRITNYVAMLALDSGEAGNRGTNSGDLSSTLHNRGHRYGRWEMRVRGLVTESRGRSYRIRLQLVPAGSAPGYDCRQAITMGEFTGYDGHTTIGAANAGSRWATTLGGTARNADNWHTYAVEVTRQRISWFLDAKVVATLRNTTAISGERLVPRLALDGAGENVWMNHTKLTADWVRYFSLARPDAKPTAAPAPTKGTFSGSS